jgi:DegV family protein with EDD domain
MLHSFRIEAKLMVIGLVTDGTCDIPRDIAAQHHVHIVPHHVIWGNETYNDGINLSSEAFYERLARDPQLPKTAQPSAAEFAAAYRTVQADTILCITTSQRITGAYGSAVLAGSMVDIPVKVIDSGTATVALGLTVLAVADAIQQGASLDNAEYIAQNAAANSRFFFTLNTLDFLYRGGRIGNGQRLIGSTLNIKPILHIQDGTVASLERTRSRKRAIARLLEIAETFTSKRPLRLAVVHSNAEERQTFSQTLREMLAPDQFFETLACSAVGVYAGPGSIGFGLVYRW